DPCRIDADGGEMKLRCLATQALDVGAGCVGLQQRVIDHPRDRAGGTANRVNAEAGRAGVDDAAKPVRAAIEEHRMTAAPRGTAARGLRRQHLLGDDVNQTLQVLRVQHVNHSERLPPSDSPTRALARRFAGSLPGAWAHSRARSPAYPRAAIPILARSFARVPTGSDTGSSPGRKSLPDGESSG